MSRARLTIVLTAAILAIGALALSAASGAQVVRLGNLIVTIEGSVSPKVLPKNTLAPITLKVSGSIATADATHVPALKTLALEFDKHGAIYTKGLPTCRVAQLKSTLTARAKKVCGDALIGSGRVSAEIALPEQAPFNAGGPLLIFNGAPKGNKPVLIFHVYAHVPAPTTFVTTAVIGPASGKYGTQTLIAIPTIVGGQGSLTSFEATIHKTWTYKAKKRSLLSAECANGRLLAHGDFTFADGGVLSGDIAKSCGVA